MLKNFVEISLRGSIYTDKLIEVAEQNMSIENSWPVSSAGYRRCEIRKEKKERKATRRWTEKMRGRVEVTRASSSSRGSRRTTLRSLCIFARLLSSSLLSYPRLVVSHALYLDACRRVLAARACSRARASQKYVILFLYIYIYIYALVSMCPPRYLCPLTVMCGPSWNPSEIRCFETSFQSYPPLIHSRSV